MKKYYFTIASILVLASGITSCSNEETKTQNQVASRPSVPILDTEVRIGNQIWMTRNLNVSRYRNGDPIPQVTSIIQWKNLTTGAWCYYNNDPANGAKYGRLYNWYAVNDPRGLAPIGWHVASDSEWTTLTAFLGGEAVAGEKMKTTEGWSVPNLATNSSGLSSLPAGGRNFEGIFYNLGNYCDYWSTTNETDASSEWAWIRFLIFNNTQAYRSASPKKGGLSVRCIKD
ncbi:fibrobacter succinogenes major paralogous domain-containing protein [Flavobacterium sp.]|uniref:fibrobacter succinogenes major paralogous domain-containing protein n=1 Tax=Flavobacterium sp. TaxID=239 RepID=UPI00260A1C78|nr:fibrobacter succinogenes major paralogous domain-containing protein [Flavobacterium sp.]